ncbi:Putative zinc ribbon domain protein [Pirellula sp. SH-Sr6A]|uniref:zinc ribbon domain-containing protein n=1 Tax=Pirellula sp. SH-Sr6A TaxID=1632865 RepID=UPI00078E62F4|nr:C4-type zinc ribbon domain-containing protein [Pirellula sp. SH-Sr6A]AMV35522.1 Putative zinc ribbon domain protein [Pirellula sp. SH-Sr6A]
MSVSDSVVRNLHHRLNHIAELESQIARGPRMVQSAQLQLDASVEALQKCKNTIRERRMDADRKQLQQRERENKIQDLESKMNASKNNREYQMLKDQIAADKQATSVLSDEIFEALEEVDALQSSTIELEERVKLAEAEKAKVMANVEKRLVDLRQDLQKANQDLAAIVSSLPQDFAKDYQRLVSARGPDALSELDGQSCGGCNTNLTPGILDKLRMGRPTICPSCGRMLYRAENA